MLLLGACEQQPTAPDQAAPFQPDLATSSLTDASNPAICGAGKKSLTATVSLTNGDPAENAVVSFTSTDAATGGLHCWATTDENGFAELEGLMKDEEGVVVVRPGIGAGVLYRQIIPPHLNFSDYGGLAALGAPETSYAGAVTYGTDCVTTGALDGETYEHALHSPCVVPGRGLELTLTLKETPTPTTITTTVIGPDGTFQKDALVSAVTEIACDTVPFLPDGYCDPFNVDNIHGAGVLQAADLTDTLGTTTLKVNGPVELEAVWQDASGTTLFGSIGSKEDQDAPILAEPGICHVNEHIDGSEPSSGSSDILEARDGYGMIIASEPVDGFRKAVLKPVFSRVVVHARIAWNGSDDSGMFTARFRSDYTRKLDVAFGFDVSTDRKCYLYGDQATGTAVTDLGVQVADGICREVSGSEDGQVFDFYFVIDGVPGGEPETTVEYSIKFAGENFDPERNPDNPALPYSSGFLLIKPPVLTDGGDCTYKASNDPRWRTV